MTKRVLKYFKKITKQLRDASRQSLFVSPFLFIPYVFLLFLDAIQTTSEYVRISLFSNTIEWYISNEDYFFMILLTIAIDHILGTWKYLKLKAFSMKENIIGFFTKLAIVVLGGLLFEAMGEIIHRDSMMKEYIVIVARLIVFLYPARSAFISMSVITNGKFPPKAWIKKIDRFEENLDPSEFKKTKE